MIIQIEINIASHFKDLDWDSWLNFLESDRIKNMVLESQGDWMNYVKAPVLRLQYLYQDKKIQGMDMAFTRNIPVAAGLSSSIEKKEYRSIDYMNLEGGENLWKFPEQEWTYSFFPCC